MHSIKETLPHLLCMWNWKSPSQTSADIKVEHYLRIHPIYTEMFKYSCCCLCGNTKIFHWRWLNASRGCPEKWWSTHLVDVQQPPGRGPGQVALGGPAWAGVLAGPEDLQRSLLTSTVLWFCGSRSLPLIRAAPGPAYWWRKAFNLKTKQSNSNCRNTHWQVWK